MKYYALCLPLVLGSLALAKPDATGDAKKAIKKAYAEMANAFVDMKFTDFSGFMTEDFKASREGHPEELTRDQVMKDFSGQRDRLSDVKWSKKISKINMMGVKWTKEISEKYHYGELVADVRVAGKMTGLLNFGDGKPHHFDLQAKSEDQWVHVGADWKLHSSHTTELVVKIDGKVTPIG